MKKVLVTGAAGVVGNGVLKYLLSEGKYEVTALDLRNKNNIKKLKRYRRRVNIIYGDINDVILIDSLIKDHDYVIHLAGILPPLADIKRNLCEKIDYDGTMNIIRAINAYNPTCMMLYASTTTVYGDVVSASVKTSPNVLDIDYYSSAKLKVEKLIQEKLKNYTIFRLPFILCNPRSGAFMYNVKLDTNLEAITDNDASYMFVRALSESDKLKNKIYNVGGGETLVLSYRELLVKVLSLYGISVKYLFALLFLDKNFYSHVYEDSNKLNEILDFRSDSFSSYLMRTKRNIKGRSFPRFMAKPFIYFLKRKIK